MRLLDFPAESRFDDIVRRAQSLFGATGAAFSVIDDTRQWNKAVAGAGVRQMPIEESFCRVTIGSSTALVVADAWNDERIPSTDATMRFYAGYPVEAVDGTRIGALCVFDEQPRLADSVDVALLRDLALATQRELQPVRVEGVRPSGPRRLPGGGPGRMFGAIIWPSVLAVSGGPVEEWWA